jgi:hypothetical protein
MEQRKEFIYAAKILSALADQLENEDNDNFIDIKEEDFDMTAFIYAVGTIAPNSLYQRLTVGRESNLEFNHLQNKLCFQYSYSEE